MNPSKEKEDTAYSTEAHYDQESANTDQETELPFVQSEEDMLMESASETAEQMIASIFGEEGEAPEYMRQEIENFCKIRKPEPACSPKKPKPADPKDNTDTDPIEPDSVTVALPRLFDVVVINSDCLRIPYEVAVGYFPASSSSSFSEQIIQLTDPFNRHWPSIGYVYFDSEKAFILTRNWVEYACLFNLQLMDTVRFVKPNPRFGNNHFKTQHLPKQGSEPVQKRLPKFLPHNSLFKVEFGQGDVRLGIERLVIDAQLVKKYFPGIRKNLKQEMVKLTDYKGKNWFVKMVYSGIGDRYILMDDHWEGFVREHELEAGDLVLFYNPNILSHDKHFLIQFIKREKGDRLTKSDDNRTTKIQEEKNKHPLSVVQTGLSDEVLSVMMSEYDGTNSIDEELMAQQKAYELFEQINVPRQISATRKISEEEIGAEPKGKSYSDMFDFDPFEMELSQKEILSDPKEGNDLDDSVFDSSGSDHKDEENQALIFEVEISESDCLIIPMMNQVFPLLMLNPDQNETLQLTDNLGHKWEMMLTYDSDLDVYVITKGWSSYHQHYNLKKMDMIRCYKHVPQQNPNHFFILHQKKIGKYLFRAVVPRSNQLSIFIDRVEVYLDPEHLQEYTIHVADYLDQIWEMKLVRFQEEKAYIVVQGWEQYVAKHGLRHKDRISFCKQKHNKKSNSFLIYHELRRIPGSDSPSGNTDMELSLFVPENIIWELCLSEADAGSGRLMMPTVEIPFLFLNQDIVKLTDEKNKDWFMIIVKVKEEYMLNDGWEGYVKEFELEAGDTVTIYSPACADHHKHLLIKCEKNKKKSEKDDSYKGKENLGKY